MSDYKKKSEISTGILNRVKGEQYFKLSRYHPSPLLADFVEHYWIVEWTLPEGYIHVQEVLPTLSVQLVFQDDESTIYGVMKKRFIQKISGTGGVVGVKFKPAGFYAFLKKPLTTIAQREMTARSLLGIDTKIALSADHAAAMEAIETLLLGFLPVTNEKIELVQQVITAAAADRTIVSTAQLAARFHLTIRTLERLFSKYAGTNPKWVIKIFRFHETVERIAADHSWNWANLANDLGYFDQAHFIKDFRMITGKTPQEYALECRDS